MKAFVSNNPAVLAFTWAIVIFLLCATPGQYIPSAHWMQLLSLDKLVHAGIFFVLTALLLLVAVKYEQGRPVIALYFISCVFYGVSLEWMQAGFFSNRSSDWLDMVANTAGCLVALFLFRRIKKIAQATKAT